MADPWSQFKDAPGDDPWGKFKDADAKPAKPNYGKGVLRKVDSAVRGAADFLSFGFADEAEAVAAAVPALVRGKDAFAAEYSRQHAAQLDRNEADKREVPVSRGVGQGAGFVMGLGTGVLASGAKAIPRLTSASRPILSGVETVGRNILAGAGYGLSLIHI